MVNILAMTSGPLLTSAVCAPPYLHLELQQCNTYDMQCKMVDAVPTWGSSIASSFSLKRSNVRNAGNTVRMEHPYVNTAPTICPTYSITLQLNIWLKTWRRKIYYPISSS